MLSSCATPTRLDTEAFTVLQEGRVSARNIQSFTDCIMDGFGVAHNFEPVEVRQHRRSGLSRVESFSGASLLVSVDIFDDGRVQILESSAAILFNTTGEKTAFKDCLVKFN